MLIEIKTHDQPTKSFEIVDENESLSFHEYEYIRFSIDKKVYETFPIIIKLGNLELISVIEDKQVYFVSDTLQDRKSDFFRQFFLNEFGYSKLSILTQTKTIEVDIEVRSSKVSGAKISAWLDTIFQVFPIIRLLGFQDARSELPKEISSSGFYSVIKILKKFEFHLSDILNSLQKPNYLQ